MLDDIDFQWNVPHEVKSSRAYRMRSRHISKALQTLQSMQEYGAFMDEEYGDVRDSDLSVNVARQIAQYTNTVESNKSLDEDSTRMGGSLYRQGLLVGVTEIYLFEAFDWLDQGGEVDTKSDEGSKSFDEWLAEQKSKPSPKRKRERATSMETKHDSSDGSLVLSQCCQSSQVSVEYLRVQFNCILLVTHLVHIIKAIWIVVRGEEGYVGERVEQEMGREKSHGRQRRHT